MPNVEKMIEEAARCVAPWVSLADAYRSESTRLRALRHAERDSRNALSSLGIPLETLAALKARTMVAVQDWQPIEMAPKDGTRFLACRVDDTLSETENPTVFIVMWGGCHGLTNETWVLADDLEGVYSNVAPTHCMPLPAAPTKPEMNDD